VPALGVTWLIVGRTLALESRIARSPTGLSEDDRTALLVTILLVAFLGFTGVAAMVPGGLVRRTARSPRATCHPRRRRCAHYRCSGIRSAALRVTGVRDALVSASRTPRRSRSGRPRCRAMEIPRLVGPALLTLAFYLWDSFIAAPGRRRDRRWIGQIAVLAGLGVIVAVWNLLLRG
jgi:hypothetical protein